MSLIPSKPGNHVNFPVEFGLKYDLHKDIAIGVLWSFVKTFKDNIDSGHIVNEGYKYNAPFDNKINFLTDTSSFSLNENKIISNTFFINFLEISNNISPIFKILFQRHCQ